MKNKVNTQRLSLRQLASRKRVAPSSVSSWVEVGCPRNADKTFSESAVDKWLASRREERKAGASLRDQKLQAEIDRIQRDIRQRDIAIDKDMSKLHDAAECDKKHTALRSAESSILNSLPRSFLAAFPEDKAKAEWLQHAIDGIVERLQNAG